MTINNTPAVILPGIGQSFVEVLGADGTALRNAWPLNLDREKAIGTLKKPLAQTLLLRRDRGFSEAAATFFSDLVDDLTIYPDGSTKYPLRPQRYDCPVSEYPAQAKRRLYRMIPMQGLADRIGEDRMFFFAYDSFGDAYALADELHAFIQNVKTRTGARQVNLLAVSLGGALANAYFDRYLERNDVHRLVNIVAAAQGTHLVSDILDHNIDPDGLASAAELFDRDLVPKIEKGLRMLPDGVAAKTIDRFITLAAEKICVNSTMIWGTVPADAYKRLEKRYLNDGLHDRVRADAARFYDMHLHYDAFIGRLIDSGVAVFNICGYGKRLFPLAASGDYMSDGVIDTACASMGALCAHYGQRLPDGYAQVNAAVPGAISPGGDIDASACLLPDRTWFFGEQGHDAIADNTAAINLAIRIFTDGSFDSVYSDAAYPRFSVHNNGR